MIDPNLLRIIQLLERRVGRLETQDTATSGISHASITLAVDADTLLGLTGQELTLDTQVANTVLAGPATGAAADPAFRALAADDIPDLAASTITVTADGFTGNLSASDTDVQTALTTLDAMAAGGITVTNILYDDLVTAIGGDDLVPLAWYRITDFATTHYIVSSDISVKYNDVGDIITGTNESLLVQAMTTSELGAQAISESFPKDILRYDWNPDNWSADLSIWSQPEEGPTLVPGFKGVITYRHDTVSDNLAYYDWRNAKTRRWAIDAAAWSAGSYAAGSYVTHLDILWYAVVTTSGVPGTSNDWMHLVWMTTAADKLGPYWCSQADSWYILAADPNDYVDVLTFQGDLTNTLANHLGRGPYVCGQLSTFANNCKNNTLEYPFSHTFDYACVGNRLGYNEQNLFGDGASRNDIGVACNVNLLGINANTVKLTLDSVGNLFGSCSSIMAFGSSVSLNVFADNCVGILLGSNEQNRIFTYGTTGVNYLSVGHTYAELDATGANAGDVLTADGSGNSAWAAPAAVVDARADDAVNTSTWDATTAGVLDALRDAMILHGLIAAA